MALVLKSQRQIQTDILNAIIARIGLTDVNPGSVLDVLTGSVAQEDFNQYVQMSQIVRLVDLDATSGGDLDTRAFEYGLTRNPALSATGQVNISRNDYTKISTTFVSSGVLAPSTGDGNTIDKPLLINDASMFINANGSVRYVGVNGPMIVIGRGTSVEETRQIAQFQPGSTTINGVLPNTGDPNTATFWQVWLTEPLAFNHAFTDEIVFVPAVPENGSANVSIAAGTTVSAPATGTNAAINFEVTVETTLFAGESTLSNVDVRAVQVGATANVGVGQINTIDLEGLGVTNVAAFTTGQDIESDASLRDRIRSHIQSLSRGTRQAVLNAIVGVVDPASSKRVVSANVILPQAVTDPVLVYIDDGTGFEPSFLAQAFETVVEDAIGTTRLQLDFAPLVKAQIESALTEPYDLSAATTTVGGLNLEVRVGTNNNDNITFTTDDLSFPATTRAEEITRIINNKATFIEARTSSDGTRVVITAKADVNEDIFVAGGTANQFIQFTNTDQSTLYLYKNDRLLSKDGSTATATTFTALNAGTNTGVYAFQGIPTLTVRVDNKGTTAAPNLQEIVLSTTENTSAQVVTQINSQLAGATAALAADGRNIVIFSNTELSSASAVEIIPTTIPSPNPTNITDANDQLLFVEAVQAGTNADYTLNRELGTLELGVALADDDVITAGNQFSRGAIRTSVSVSNSSTVQMGTQFTLTIDATFNSDGTINESVSRIVTFDERFTGTFLTGTTAVDSKPDDLYGFNRTQIQSGGQDLPTFIASYINDTIFPYATAFVRTVANNRFIEIRTNSYGSSQVSTTDGSSAESGNIRLIIDTPLLRGLWSNEPDVAVNDSSQFSQNERPHTAFRENSNVEPQSGRINISGTSTAVGNITVTLADAIANISQTFTIPIPDASTASAAGAIVSAALRPFFDNAVYNDDNTISLVYNLDGDVFLKHRNALTISGLTGPAGLTVTSIAFGTEPTLGYLFAPADNLIVVMDNDSTNKTFPVPMNNTTRVGGVTNSGNFVGDGITSTFASADTSYYGTILANGTDRDVGSIHDDANLLNYYASFNGSFIGVGREAGALTDSNKTITIDAARNHLRIPSTGNVVITPEQDLGVGNCAPFQIGGTEISCKLTEAGTWTYNDITNFITVDAANNAPVGATITVGQTVFTNGSAPGNWQTGTMATDTAQSIVDSINGEEANGFTAAVRSGTQVHITTTPATNYQNTSGVNTLAVSTGSGLTAGNAFVTISRTTSPITRVARDLNRRRSTFFIGSGGTGIVLSDLTNLGFRAGDIITVAGLRNEVNNGSFVILDIGADNAGVPFITVFDPNGLEETNSTGSCVISQKRRVTSYPAFQNPALAGSERASDTAAGNLIFNEVFPDTPLFQDVGGTIVGGDQFDLIPSTLENLDVQFNNPRLSSLSLSAELENVERGLRFDIASLLAGSAGFVLVSGGVANNELGFITTATQGLQAYNYYTGLLQRVHNTIYGDDTDLVTFPGIGAAGNRFSVLAPTITEIIVEIDITLNEGVSIAAVENEVNTAVTGYINALGVGADVIVEEIRARIIRISGIGDVAITRLTGGAITSTTNIANIAIADNEIARIAVSDITLG